MLVTTLIHQAIAVTFINNSHESLTVHFVELYSYPYGCHKAEQNCILPHESTTDITIHFTNNPVKIERGNKTLRKFSPIDINNNSIVTINEDYSVTVE